MTNKSSSGGKQKEPFSGEIQGEQATVARKPYRKPEFRFEPVFEVAALACGKQGPTQSGCQFNRNTS